MGPREAWEGPRGTLPCFLDAPLFPILPASRMLRAASPKQIRGCAIMSHSNKNTLYYSLAIGLSALLIPLFAFTTGWHALAEGHEGPSGAAVGERGDRVRTASHPRRMRSPDRSHQEFLDASDDPQDEDENVGSGVVAAPETVAIGDRTVLGWVEWVGLLPDSLQMKSKLDSGARTSSMHAVDVTELERDGVTWVRFSIPDPETDEMIDMERPVVRFLRIVQHDGQPQRRPVVKLEVKLGEIHQEVAFSLADRSNFIYPVLIGRNYLRGRALIDTEQTFLSERPFPVE